MPGFIIWDFDGTLFDSMGKINYSFGEVLRWEYGYEVALDKIAKLTKVDTRHCIHMLSAELDLDETKFYHEVRNYYDNESEFEEGFFSANVEILKNFGRHGHNFLVTHRDRLSTFHHLDSAGLRSEFKDIICKEDGFPEKPNPGSFRHILSTHELDPVQGLAIGDRNIDLLAAEAAGLPGILFDNENQEHFAATLRTIIAGAA